MYQESFTIHGATLSALKNSFSENFNLGFTALEVCQITPTVWMMQEIYRNGVTSIHIIEEKCTRYKILITSNGELFTDWELDARKILRIALGAAASNGWTVEGYNEKLLNTPLSALKKIGDKIFNRL